jgi:hypothetical protein
MTLPLTNEKISTYIDKRKYRIDKKFLKIILFYRINVFNNNSLNLRKYFKVKIIASKLDKVFKK